MIPEYWNADPNGPPLYQQLYESIRQSVVSGHASPGERMPSIRKLSEELKISRTTVESAYQQLCVEGYLLSRPQSGYYVADLRLRPEQNSPTAHRPTEPERSPAAFRYRFSTSSVDSNAFRVDLWRRYLRNVLNEPDGLFTYGEPQGESALREAIAEYSGRVRGVSTTPDRIVIGAGIQPLLLILCGLLHPTVHTVGMESPGFAQAEQIFSDCSFRVHPLASDPDGPLPSALPDPAGTVLYITPANRSLSGAPIPLSRRYELLEWVRRGGILVEDDNNGELRYRSRPVPAMQGLDSDAAIVYLGTFSKVLMPAVRISYMVLPPTLAESYRAVRENYNQTASKTEQLALAQYIREGQLERQLRKMRKIYGTKGELLVNCLKAHLPNARFFLQETALRVLIRPDLGLDSAALVHTAAERGVYVRAYGNPADGVISIGFSGIPQEKIAPGIETLCDAWKKACEMRENLVK